MFNVRTRTTMSGREIAILQGNGRYAAGAASLSFIEWMSERVPRRQLSTEQAALVDWYEKRRPGQLVG